MNTPVSANDEREKKPKIDNWYKLYGGSWSGLISPNAVAHPAKFSRKLIFRIFEHAIEEGWIKPGDTCLDVFCGVALGALPAMMNGLHWQGVELEARFCVLAQQNIDLWNKRYSEQMPNWGTAVIVQGDSRRLGEVLERAQICLSSPPFVGIVATQDPNFLTPGEQGKRSPSKSNLPNYGSDPANLGNLPDTGFEAALAVASPGYCGSEMSDNRRKDNAFLRGEGRSGNRKPSRGDLTSRYRVYSEDEAQLAQMPEGDLALALGSPPYAGGCAHTGGDDPNPKHIQGGEVHHVDYGQGNGQLAALPEGDHAEACERPVCAISSPPYATSPVDAYGENPGGGIAGRKSQDIHHKDWKTGEGYGSEEGQLGQMPPGSHAAALGAGAETGRAQACISSPPWEKAGTNYGCDGDVEFAQEWQRQHGKRIKGGPMGLWDKTYGDTAGQLGQETGSTFWSASRQILEEVYRVLAPGGHAIFVCKRFVRDKKIVEFSTQWAHLCEAVGFKWIHHHKAWLVEDRGAQHTLEGGLEKREVRRLSFFRRLHSQKYPHLAILWEDVLCFVKE